MAFSNSGRRWRQRARVYLPAANQVSSRAMRTSTYSSKGNDSADVDMLGAVASEVLGEVYMV